MSNVDATLKERGAQYGTFAENSKIMQGLKKVMRAAPNWDNLTASQQEALEMNAHKIGRILGGNPDHIDSWHDIIGYARLIEQELIESQKPVVITVPSNIKVRGHK